MVEQGSEQTSDQASGSILIFGYGNPSRGDDALGPLFLERILERIQRQPQGGAGADHLARLRDQLECLTDFQLQIEHALDLLGRALVLFVDASESGPEPFTLVQLHPDAQLSYTTHAMSPSAVLAVYQQTQRQPLPPCWLLAIRGYDFDELGAPLSLKAETNLTAAVEAVIQWLLSQCGAE